MEAAKAWVDFLTQLNSGMMNPVLTLVGPLFGAPHAADGPTIYVDGGAKFRQAQGRWPVLSVGDGDSGAAGLDVLLPADKDISDLGYVLAQIPQSVTHVKLLGFSGARRDHELANYGEVHRFLCGRETFARVDLPLADGGKRVFALTHGSVEEEIHGLFSVFTFANAAITISGACRYRLSESPLRHPVSSHGLSNEGHGMVRFQSQAPMFVFVN